jgi:hypothetical protein
MYNTLYPIKNRYILTSFIIIICICLISDFFSTQLLFSMIEQNILIVGFIENIGSEQLIHKDISIFQGEARDHLYRIVVDALDFSQS